MEKLINEEFLDEKTIQVEMAIHFNFGGFEMVLELLEPRDGTFNIYKKENGVNHLFQTSFNAEKRIPKIIWERDIPLDVDIRVATDVMVAKMYKSLRENGFLLPFKKRG
jgi:hypothetical protein